MRAALGLLGFLGLLGLQVSAEPAPRVPLRTRTYIIHIEKKPRTVQLRQQVFLPEDFRIYTVGRGGLAKSELAHAKRDCFYEGSIEGSSVSLVALSACAGLSGLLQLVSVSYGIKPLEASTDYQHLVYPMVKENLATQLFLHNSSLVWTGKVLLTSENTTENKQAVSSSSRYVEMHAVLDKLLYDYMGADKDAVTAKMVQLFSYLNSVSGLGRILNMHGKSVAVVQMFSHFNVTIVLSSLEFWTEDNKIPTTGSAEEMLQEFLQWKNVHRVLQLQDITFLFLYRNQSRYVGASSARKACVKNQAGGVALYHSTATLETFAVIVARLLGRSLGMAYERPRGCRCAVAACVMQNRSELANGVKVFSNCSIKEFQRFVAAGEGQCLLNRPALDLMYKVPVCGNKVVEPGEACDCGSAEECQRDPCCTTDCKMRRGMQCVAGPCCRHCQFMKKGTLCRSSIEDECDLEEYCNGTSGECTPDLWVMDGHPCRRNTAFCYRGVCQTADKQCQDIFGRGAKDGPFDCYEEINSQRDRMGHCGSSESGYQRCEWKDLRCGKLVCEYPGSKPFTKEKATVIYMRVQNKLCVTLDYMKPLTERDPMLVKDGTICSTRKICQNQHCVPAAVLNNTCDTQNNCHGHGVCDNQGKCRCHPGWKPPMCQEKGHTRFKDLLKLWLPLIFCLFLPLAFLLVLLERRRREKLDLDKSRAMSKRKGKVSADRKVSHV